MPAPTEPYQPYASLHSTADGPGDARPTALQIVKDTDMVNKLSEKTVLITGCSSGIGVETARALYECGARLFLAARDIGKLEKVIDDIVSTAKYNKSGARPETVELHLESFDGVRKGAEEFKAKSDGKLNILINNAGVMACPYGKTTDGFETQIGTNHFGHFLLFQLLKPLLLQSAKDSKSVSRVMNVSSAGHRFSGIRFDDVNFTQPDSYHKWQSYGQSKTANIYMAASIHRHYASQNLIGLSVHPGGIMTELGRHLDEEDLNSLGDPNPLMKLFKSPEQGAATTVWAAVSPHFKKLENGGRYLADVGEDGPLAENADIFAPGYAKYIYDEEAEEKLWDLSYEAVGLKKD